MLKMYHRHEHEGGSPGFWEDAWGDGRYEEALRFCDNDPLRPIFDAYVKPGQWMLEGGCGRGQYVAYYSRRGVRMVGLDFACQALAALRRRDHGFELCAGDVACLPFRDASFDVYYSGGVVEHFESGPGPSLAEARRVLHGRGILLISVPYLSPLRRLVARIRPHGLISVDAPCLNSPDAERTGRFYQYAYAPGEFRRLLSMAGFKVIAKRGYSILWGLYDLPGAANISKWLERRVKLRVDRSGQETARVAESKTGEPESAGKSLLRRLVIAEDDSVPFAGPVIRALRWACANMMMYVCVCTK